jgi:4-diphosphocytidyl-2-C-methyl-D-erythritol kinase
MLREIVVQACAKVNLHLEVLARRPDGFHEILSLFQAVSLADVLTVRRSGKDGDCSIEGAFGFPAQSNIITKAVRLFRSETGRTAGVTVSVEKKIPMAAGLGGGSSDAAATLRCLIALFDAPVDPVRAHRLAQELGSDVPFFLGGPAAVVEGRGEKISALSPRSDFSLVAVMPGVPVSTKEAFRVLDELQEEPQGVGLSREGLLGMYRDDPPSAWRFYNSFDPVADRLSPRFAAARESLLAAGASAARLTGSGDTVIGVFDDDARAEAAARFLRGTGIPAVRLCPLAAIPALCYTE